MHWGELCICSIGRYYCDYGQELGDEITNREKGPATKLPCELFV